ncbi:hypothetical protein ACU4GH_31390 [Bradyrhizobium betae]
MRSERDQVIEAVRETPEIGREAAIPAVISHKCIGRRNFGKTTVTLELIDRALATQDVAPRRLSLHRQLHRVCCRNCVGEAERIIVASSQPPHA